MAQNYDMSSVQAAEMAREVFRQTVGTMPFSDSQRMLAVVAKENQVLSKTRNFTPEQTTNAAVTMSHLFQSYDASNFEHMADLGLRLAELSPTSLTQANTQFTLMEPTLKGLGVKDDDVAALYVALSRGGFGKGKGGSGVADLINAALGPLQQTKHAQSGKAKILRDLGVTDAKGNSTFFTTDSKGNAHGDLFGFLRKLEDDRKRLGAVKFAQEVHGAFGIQGGKIADFLANPVISQNLDNIEKLFNGSKQTIGLDHQAKSIKMEPQTAVTQAAHNFQTMMTSIGAIALPAVNKGFRDLSKEMNGVTNWLESHKGQTAAWSRDITGALITGEKFLVQHTADFDNLGKAAENAFKLVGALWPELKLTLDVSLRVVGAAAKIASTFEDLATRLLNLLGPLIPHTVTADDNKLRPRLDPSNHTRFDWNRKPAGPTPVTAPEHDYNRFHRGNAATDHRTGTRRVVPQNTSNNHTSVGPVSIIIQASQDHQKTAKAVQVALENMGKLPNQNMRGQATHPLMPLAHSLGLG